MDVKRFINQKAAEKNSWLLKITLNCSKKQYELLKQLHPISGQEVHNSELCEILQVGSVVLHNKFETRLENDIEIKKTESLICPRCRRYVVLHEHDLCERCQKVLQLQK